MNFSKLYTPTTTSFQIQQTALALCISLNVNIIIWGNPGEGKTSTIKAIAEANNFHLETIVLAAKGDPAEIHGQPYLDNGTMRYAATQMVRSIKGTYEQNGQISISFWDEISNASPSAQAVALTGMLDRVIGEEQLPPETRMVGAANPPKVAANGWDLSAPSANRFVHLDWDLDAKTMSDGFMNGWRPVAIPLLPFKKMPNLVENAKILIGAFFLQNPEHAKHDFNAGTRKKNPGVFRAADYAFPSSRSWEFAAHIFAGANAARVNVSAENPKGDPLHPDVLKILLEGCVGVPAATAFLRYIKGLELPNPVDILQHPDKMPLLDRGDLIAASLSKTETYALRYANSEHFPQIWSNWGDYIIRYIEAGKADITLPYAQRWNEARPDGTVMNARQLSAFEELFAIFGQVQE